MDILKLQEKNKLAKALVEQGIASNIQDAFTQIETQGLVKEFGDTVMEEMKMEDAVEAVQRQQKRMIDKDDLNNLADLMHRLEIIENTMAGFKEFFTKYKDLNDNNLKEVDARLKEIAKRIISMSKEKNNQQQTQQSQEKTQQQTQETQQKLPEKPKLPPIEHPQAGLNPNDFSVEKYFDNSHGKRNK